MKPSETGKLAHNLRTNARMGKYLARQIPELEKTLSKRNIAKNFFSTLNYRNYAVRLFPTHIITLCCSGLFFVVTTLAPNLAKHVLKYFPSIVLVRYVKLTKIIQI